MTHASQHIVFAGGGTAGHLFPGLAVAEELIALPAPPRITFAGSGKSFERKRVAEAGFEYLELPCAPAPAGARGIIPFLTKNISGHRAARRFLRREDVDVVVGLGGYASVPMARAAISTDTPLVVLEQNVYPGKATRWLASHAALVCTAFEQTRQYLRCVGPVRVTGNPLRSGFRPRTKERTRTGTWQHRLVVLGGSGGARSLNEQIPRALYKLHNQLTGWQIVHQSGVHDVAVTGELYRKLALEATVVPFVHNLAQVLRSTDLVVCRAGGTTLAELAATGVPALLIPYPHATDNHQRLNAQLFVASGAARMIDEREIDVRLDDTIAAMLIDLLGDAYQRRLMAASMRQLAHPDAAWQVAMMVHDLACQRVPRNVA